MNKIIFSLLFLSSIVATQKINSMSSEQLSIDSSSDDEIDDKTPTFFEPLQTKSSLDEAAEALQICDDLETQKRSYILSILNKSLSLRDTTQPKEIIASSFKKLGWKEGQPGQTLLSQLPKTDSDDFIVSFFTKILERPHQLDQCNDSDLYDLNQPLWNDTYSTLIKSASTKELGVDLFSLLSPSKKPALIAQILLKDFEKNNLQRSLSNDNYRVAILLKELKKNLYTHEAHEAIHLFFDNFKSTTQAHRSTLWDLEKSQTVTLPLLAFVGNGYKNELISYLFSNYCLSNNDHQKSSLFTLLPANLQKTAALSSLETLITKISDNSMEWNDQYGEKLIQYLSPIDATSLLNKASKKFDSVKRIQPFNESELKMWGFLRKKADLHSRTKTETIFRLLSDAPFCIKHTNYSTALENFQQMERNIDFTMLMTGAGALTLGIVGASTGCTIS